MARKLCLLLAAVAVAAVVLPASVSAAPALTDGKGNLLKIGTQITASSTNMVTKTSLGTITCTEAEAFTVLTENSGSLLEAVGFGEGVTFGCKLGTTSIKITDFTMEELDTFLFTSGKGTIALTFEADLPGVTCHFDSHLKPLPFTYKAGSNVLEVPSAEILGSPEACGVSTFSATFTLSQTAGGGAVVLD